MSLILFDGLKWTQWHQFQTSNISNILFQNSNAMAIAGGKLLKRVQSVECKIESFLVENSGVDILKMSKGGSFMISEFDRPPNPARQG